MKLLIVDDSLIMRRAIERSVSRHHFTEIRVASDGAAAVAEFERFRPDVVTMDITMPNMDGLSAVELIRQASPKARILVISALADRSTAVRAIKRGARGFLLKPITAEALQQALRDLLED